MGLIKLTPKQSYDRWYALMCTESAEYNTWVEQCQQNKNFYFGEQYTTDEKALIQERGQYDIVINKVRKAMRGLTGMLAASIPKCKAMPVGGEPDLEKSVLASKVLQWVFQKSGDVQMYRKVVKRAAVDNIAYFHIIYSEKENCVKYVPLYFDDVIIDMNSKDPLFRDAGRIYIKKYIPVEMAKAVYGIDELGVCPANGFWEDRDDYETRTTFELYLRKMYDKTQNYVKIYECYKKLYIRQNDGSVRTKIQKETLVGFDHCFIDDSFPDAITEYPIIPVYAEDTETPYKFGEVHFLKDLQRFINKSYGVMLLNAQLSSNPKVFVKETDIPNMDFTKFKNEYAVPGSINVLTGNAGAPIVVQGQPINSAFSFMYQDAKNEMEWNTMPSAMLGQMDTSTMGQNPSSYLLDMKETVLDSYKDFASNIESACCQLGKVILQYVRAYLKAETLVRIFDQNNSMEQIILNKKQGLDLSNPQSVQVFQQQMKKNGASDEEVQQVLTQAQQDNEFASSLSYIVNSTEDFDMDIYIVPGSYSPTFEMAMLRLMMELSKNGSVDPSMVLHYAPVENRKELIERYDTIRQQQQQIESMSKALDELEKSVKTKDKQIVQQEVEMVVSSEKLKLERMANEQKLKSYIAKQMDKLLTKEKQNELAVGITKILMDEKIKAIQREAEEKKEEPKKITDLLIS